MIDLTPTDLFRRDFGRRSPVLQGVSSLDLESHQFVPVPVPPLLLKESGEYGMFERYTRYPWVLPIHRYETKDRLIAVLGEQVIEPADRMAFELRAASKQVPVLQRKSTDEPSRT